MMMMTGRLMLTFSHTLSFAFLRSIGGKSDKGMGVCYSEQLFLTHSFCPFSGSQYHAGRVGLGNWVRLGRWVRSG
jgi:hypothetical protein